MRKLVIRLPPPHPKQKLIELSTKKRVIVPTGRRFGKTTLVARKSVKLAAVGRKVLYCAPVTSQTDAYWQMCNKWLSNAILTHTVSRNATKRNLTFPTGGSIMARTAYKPDHLRGDYADYLILDEYAYQNPEIWTKVGSPMLLDNDGDVVFISSPDRRNHFYTLYLRAKEDPRWDIFSASSHDNPHLSKSALADLLLDMLEEDYEQEILGKFVEGEGQVFKLHLEDFGPALPIEKILQIHQGHRIVAGLDWGRKKDYTVLDLGCATCQQELHYLRFTQTDYPSQRDFITGLLTQFEKCGYNVEVLAEANAMGLPNIEQMQEDGVAIIPFDMTHSSKGTVVQGLRLCFAQRSWKWLDDDISRNELESYEMSITPRGNVTYGAPTGLHDDITTARMLMYHQSIMGMITLGTM